MAPKQRTDTHWLAVHCSATPEEMDIGVEEIDRWHKERGWIGCGYHFVIRKDGTVETGRDIDAIGAHVRGFNQTSIGICLVGTSDFTDEQYTSLKTLISDVLEKYPDATVRGHRDFPSVKKDCPNFDVPKWWMSQP